MEDTSAPPYAPRSAPPPAPTSPAAAPSTAPGAHPAPVPSRLSFAGVCAVIPGGLLSLTWFWISLTLLIAGIGGLLALGSGVLLLIPWVLLMQAAVRIERRRAVAVHRIEVIVPRRRRSRRAGFVGWLHGLWLEITSGAFWRGVLHHHLAMLVAGVFFILFLSMLWVSWTAGDIAVRAGELALGPVVLPRWSLVALSALSAVLALLMLVLGGLSDRGLARGLISGSEDDLREQVAEMSERRQGAVDAAAQERLRIERDLHDGVQPRLVALAMTLGMAKGAIRRDPDRAEELVSQAHGEAKGIMTDLRQLARGIHPAVLTDRGLDAALSAIAARSSVPVDLRVELSGPLDREREAVAYFVVAEALTNIARHAQASRASVLVAQSGDVLRVRVEDDGRGGAIVHRDGVSTGLAGLTDRVRATGGRLEIASPAGGGTALLAVIPLPTLPRSGVPQPSTQQPSTPQDLGPADGPPAPADAGAPDHQEVSR